jgi:L-serine dehydratase
MPEHIPSIFNDVVGPVMRGPSSSHSAAALRIGKMCRDLMGGKPGKVVVSYDSQDALATTHNSQGSDMGMIGGLLGFEADDERLLDPGPHLEKEGIQLSFEVVNSGRKEANLYMLQLQNENQELRVEGISLGGGMAELIRLDDAPLSIRGDYYETLVYATDAEQLKKLTAELDWSSEVLVHSGPKSFVQIKSRQEADSNWISEVRNYPFLTGIRTITPVLPVLSGNTQHLPFRTYKQMMEFADGSKMEAWQLALAYESARGADSHEKVLALMRDRYRIIRQGVETGLRGTTYRDRIYGAQSLSYQQEQKQGSLSKDEALHAITLYVSALMEVKSSMGTIVAAPTAGSCGTFPGAVLGLADTLEKGEDDIIQALLTGSLVGLFIAGGATFSAEVGGCQAECGAGSGMAAAALVFLLGGSLEQSMSAASMALQNSLGMICDPIAARVEAPCLGKNISSAANALTSANLAMAGYDHLIPLDEVIETMDRVGKSLPRELRCTALGGLAITPTAKELEERLRRGNSD